MIYCYHNKKQTKLNESEELKKMVEKEFEYELDCRYDSRASFYCKARVYEFKDGSSALKSYSTIVACILKKEDGTLEAHVNGQYSPTTTRHTKEYLRQSGFKADTIGQILNDYGDSEEKGYFDWKIFKRERGL